MPGGLASWLGDDERTINAKLPRRPRVPSRAAAAPVIDVDAASPGATAAGGGKTNLPRAPAGSEAWDPFSSKGTREDASQSKNAFALLRKGAAAAKQPATSTASTPSPPAWREGSRPPASSWDPFGAPLADGKENRGNAFSRLLAAPASQQHQSAQRRNSSGGPGKKAKLNNNSSSGGGGGSPEADAVTRFCECPVCGERVRIRVNGTPFCRKASCLPRHVIINADRTRVYMHPELNPFCPLPPLPCFPPASRCRCVYSLLQTAKATKAVRTYVYM